MRLLDQKGNVATYAILAMTMMAALGTGMLYLSTTASFAEIGRGNLNQAYQLALSGKEYALVMNLPDTAAQYPGGRDFMLSNNDKFRLVISGDQIESTGIVKEGTPFEARRKVIVTKAGFSSQAEVSFSRDIAAFDQGKIMNSPGFVNVDQTQKTITLGGGQYSQFGGVWYAPSSTALVCPDGKCEFGTGIRAYFVFQFAPGSTGDGFTFALVNGTDNSKTSIGGHSGWGELLAYAGDSRLVPFPAGPANYRDGVGLGLRPPKLAVEFDPYQNPGGCNDANACGNGDRCDDPRNHMGYVFWGDESSCCMDVILGRPASFDDNKHGAGTGGNPQNARSGLDDATSHFNGSNFSWGSDWLINSAAGNNFALRIEITRGEKLISGSYYSYAINTWIKKCASSGCPEFSGKDFENTKNSYAPAAPDDPVLSRSIQISQADHAKFSTTLFGWTAATGGATQNVSISNFRMNFIKEPVGCGAYSVWNNSGATRYFNVNGGTVCMSVGTDSFIANLGPHGSITGFTDSSCTTPCSPASISYSSAVSADANSNCLVNFDATDR